MAVVDRVENDKAVLLVNEFGFEVFISIKDNNFKYRKGDRVHLKIKKRKDLNNANDEIDVV